MKKGLLTAAFVLGISACNSMAPFPEQDKTPLTPMGRLNACVLDQSRTKAANPEVYKNVNLAANQVANYCIRSLDMLDSGLYGQAVLNATSIINSYKN